jgi:ABC transport system ATP-binding/permease protein
MGERLTRDHVITVPLDGRRITVGRDAACEIVLSGVGISRRHATILLDPALPVLEDTGSSFGIRVDGEQVRYAPLCDGAVVTIGVARFRVMIAEQQLSFRPLYEGRSEVGPRPADYAAGVMRIGRDAESDIHCPHPLVSRFHAALHVGEDGRCLIADQHSTNGTFVNGRAVRRAEISDGDIVQVGPFRFFLQQGALVQADDVSRVRIEASQVTVKRGARLVLDRVSLTVEPGEFVAILGPSGAGKSTLAAALTGQVLPDRGEVFLNAMPLKRFASAFSSTIGFVSQHNLLPGELTVREIFEEQGLLRLPADSRPRERRARIDEVLQLLQLDSVAGHRARSLSGGEARRVHLGIELLSSPALVLLDEPLAGLDFGLVRSFMELFRAISDRGHTILLTTHTLEQIELCDRVLFINKGCLVYQGSPGEMGTAFGVGSIGEVYDKVKRDNITRLQHTPETTETAAMETQRDSAPPVPGRRIAGAPFLRQVSVLAMRYWRTLVRDRRNLILVGAQAPLIALLLMFVFGRGADDFLPLSFYFAVTVSAIWVGGVNTVREIAREWPILRREHRVGLRISAYLSAKGGFFVALSALQGLLFGACLDLMLTQFDLTWHSALLLAAGSAGGALLGLCISALSAGVNKAISMLPLVFMPQIFFAGALMPFDRMSAPGRLLSHVTVARPVFALLKRVCVLEQSLWDREEWMWFLAIAAGLSILTWAGVTVRTRQGNDTQ